MPDVTVKLTIGAFSVEATGPQDYVDQKVNDFVQRFVPSHPRTVSPEPVSTIAPAALTDAAGKKVSPAEFLRKVSHTNQLDRALALGFYLEKVENTAAFTTKDLIELSRQVKYPFGNISESVSRLVGRGLLMSAGDKDGVRAYSLTATGESMIESMSNKV